MSSSVMSSSFGSLGQCQTVRVTSCIRFLFDTVLQARRRLSAAVEKGSTKEVEAALTPCWLNLRSVVRKKQRPFPCKQCACSAWNFY